MNILVTGSSGFVGKKLWLEYQWLHNLTGFDLVFGQDIRDRYALEFVFSKGQFDATIHLAARAGVPLGEMHREEYMSTNVIGTGNIIEMCQKYDVKKLIFFSSSSVLGGNRDKDVGLTESVEYNPNSVYGISKVAGEMLVKNSGLSYAIVRPFTIYGEEGRTDMVIYKWINQIKAGKPISFYGSGSTKRGYTHVGDIVSAIDPLLSYLGSLDDMPHLRNMRKELVVNIGGAEVVSLRELLELFTSFCDKNSIEYEVEERKLPAYDIESSFANTALAENVLDFRPKKRFKKTINQILKTELSS